MDTSRYLYELWKGFLSEFCGVYHLEWFAEFIILPFFWGFVWFVLRRNTSKKKLWLGVGLVLPVLLLVLWINAGTFFERPGKFFITLSPYFVGIAASFFFKVRKKLHYAMVPVFALLVYSAFALWEAYPPKFYPFGEIKDSPLPKEAQKLANGADFELRVKFADAWYMDARVTALRVKGDSIYACFLKDACGVKFSEVDSCGWQPLGDAPQARPEMMDIARVRQLRDSVIAYQEELIPYLFFDGYIFEILLLDYSRGVKRYLEIGNAKLAEPMDVEHAKRLQEMAELYLEPYDDSQAYLDSLKRCQQGNLYQGD